MEQDDNLLPFQTNVAIVKRCAVQVIPVYISVLVCLPTLCMGSDYHGMDSAFQNKSDIGSLNLQYCKQEESLD